MLKRISLSALVTHVMVLCAVGLTVNTVHGMYKRSHQPATIPWDTVRDWAAYSSGGLRIGPENARLTLVVFSDYQCPVCLRMDHDLQALLEAHRSELSVVFRQFPLSFHPFARPAAVAAECAAAQERFEPYHERLFEHQAALGQESWEAVAAAVRVPDLSAFSRCLTDGRASALVDRDTAAGHRLGVFGTPTVLIGQEEYVGIPWDFDAIVERHIAAATRAR